MILIGCQIERKVILCFKSDFGLFKTYSNRALVPSTSKPVKMDHKLYACENLLPSTSKLNEIDPKLYAYFNLVPFVSM